MQFTTRHRTLYSLCDIGAGLVARENLCKGLPDIDPIRELSHSQCQLQRNRLAHRWLLREQKQQVLRGQQRCTGTQHLRLPMSVCLNRQLHYQVALQFAPALQGPDGMQGRHCITSPRHSFQRSAVITFSDQQQSLSGIANPSIAVRQRSDQFVGGRRRQLRKGALRFSLAVTYPPDTSHTDGSVQLPLENLLAQLICQKMIVLHDATVHVDDIKRTIGTIVGIDWPKALIRRP